ncbi:hypothetical protein ARMGADRAFT_1085209 [Armillaria gallica]|uniref:Uncharacterized protein n=1 Tax=Armillaria gallica TaxID=47427 RepID=A0A2H3DAJ0_ARMGA|nr:hypothetical protein ARMGADRAFT_1085209 [Armillaria gallica]
MAFYPTSHPMPSPLAHPIIYHTPALCSRSPRFTISIVTILAIVVAVVAGLVFQVPSRRRMASDLESPAISQRHHYQQYCQGPSARYTEGYNLKYHSLLPNAAFKLERYSAAKEIPGSPDDEIVDEEVPTLDHCPSDGLPVNSGVDVVNGARRLEDERLEVKAVLEKLTASVSEATLLCTQDSLALDEERERRLCCSWRLFQIFVGKDLRMLYWYNFTQKELQPSPVANCSEQGADWQSEVAVEYEGSLRRSERRCLLQISSPIGLLMMKMYFPPRDRQQSLLGSALVPLKTKKRLPVPSRSKLKVACKHKRDPPLPHSGEDRSLCSYTEAPKDIHVKIRATQIVTNGKKNCLLVRQMMVFHEARPPTNPSRPPTVINKYLLAPRPQSHSSDPDRENIDPDLDLDSSSESDSPLISWNSIFGAISNGISAEMAWYTNPPVSESISTRRPICLLTSPRPPTSSSAVGLTRRARQTAQCTEEQKDRATLQPQHPHIVEDDDFLNLELSYEKDPLSTLREEDSGILDTCYEHILNRDLRDVGVKEYCERHLLLEP